MKTMPDAQRPLRTSRTAVRESEDGVIVQRTDTPVEVALNPTAYALWELCDGDTTVAEMVAAVCDLFAVTREQAERDVAEGINQMRATGLIR